MNSYVKLANKNNLKEIQAFFELDTKRYKIKKELGQTIESKFSVSKIGQTTRKSPVTEFHSLMTQKMGNKRGRSEAQSKMMTNETISSYDNSLGGFDANFSVGNLTGMLSVKNVAQKKANDPGVDDILL